MTKIVGLKIDGCSRLYNANIGAETDIDRGGCGARSGSIGVEGE